MGLDMYLTTRGRFSGYNFEDDAKKRAFADLMNGTNLLPYIDESSPDATIEFTIGYWRKANAIHGWFIKNCANGDGDAVSMPVSREQLTELRDVCLEVMRQRPEFVMPAVSTVREFDAESPGEIERMIREATILESHNREFNNPDASDPLPPVSGFFFGSTEKDEGYYYQVERTIQIIDKCLSLPSNFYFGYEASW